ncbi:uncharacterized protein LOC131553263 [Onychostoma macrolepis]|uniref:uncharacterized protein LOC131553263 n=1 Tax=Onychostoma macrolepis TaxID=369639 RepID=UPI0027299D46|nr:uncharacterized protein LOC131553263 [Onychostoma macrolepis]
MAHQLPGDAGRVSSTETLSDGPKRSPCVGAHRQHRCGHLHQPPGRSVFAPPLQAGAPEPCVVPGQIPLAESSSHFWASQYGSRHPVETGAEARGMDASAQGGEADMESFLARLRWTCYDLRDIAHSALVLSDSSSSTALVQTWPRLSLYTFFPDHSAPVSSGESAPGRGPYAASSPVLARPSTVLGPDFSLRRLSMGDSHQEGSPLTGGEYDPSPQPGVVEAVGVAPEGAQLIASCLSAEVVETILQSRAPSTRKLYALKWRLFTSWCGDRQLDPVYCPVGTVLEFLQAQISTGLTHSTLKVYMAAIAAYRAPPGGQSVGRHPLVTRYLRGARSLRPPARACLTCPEK